jgi:1,2-diacylglycerol 3-beta-galactosyltransferase
MGLQDSQIVVHGLPIRPAFARRQPSKKSLRGKLGLQRDVPAVLVVAGGEGMGPVEKTCSAIARASGASVQLVVVTGRNAKLAERLRLRQWPSGMHVAVQGFVHNMEEWMHACDVIITKAGPGTIAESFICGLPVLLNGFIPGQEEGNIEYVLEHQVGAFEREPRAIAETVQAWAGKGADRSEFNRMVSRAKALGKPDALFSICRDLAALAEHPSFLPGPNGRLPLALQPA